MFQFHLVQKTTFYLLIELKTWCEKHNLLYTWNMLFPIPNTKTDPPDQFFEIQCISLNKTAIFSAESKIILIAFISTAHCLQLLGIHNLKALVGFKQYHSHLGRWEQAFFPYIDHYNLSGSPEENRFYLLFGCSPSGLFWLLQKFGSQIDFCCCHKK